MDVQIAQFDPMSAGEADLAAQHELMEAARTVDYPEDPVLTFDSAIGRLRMPPTDYGPCRHWTAHRGGRLVGTALVGFPGSPNDQLALTEIRVHPDSRRTGVGRSLLAAVLPTVSQQGRTVVAGGGLKDGSAGAEWARMLGFRTTQRVAMQQLVTADVDQRIWQVDGPMGYRLERWVDDAPPELVSLYVKARSAIHDRPLGDDSFRSPQWTVERLREFEDQLRRENIEQRVVVAVQEESGEVAGLTIIQFYPHRPRWGYQQDTAVLKEHRGRGLGRYVKAAMLRWLAVERPDLERIFTSTAAENSHMIRVNHAVGFTTVRIMCSVEAATAELCERLGVLAGPQASMHAEPTSSAR